MTMTMTTPFQEAIDRIANRGGPVDSRDLLQFTEALRDELSGVETRIRQLEQVEIMQLEEHNRRLAAAPRSIDAATRAAALAAGEKCDP